VKVALRPSNANLYMKTKVEITIHIPFFYKGWVAVFFYTKVITSRNRMQTYGWSLTYIKESQEILSNMWCI